MNSKRIQNNIEYIIGLFEFYCKLKIDEYANFKQHNNGDLAVYFTHNAKSLIIYYENFKDEYVLCDLNVSGNKNGSHKYHIQQRKNTLPSLIRFISTLHR